MFGLGWDPAEEQQKFDRFVSRPGSELLLTVGRPARPAGASEMHFVLIAPSPSPICCDFTEERGGGSLLKATISLNGRQGFRNTFSALGESVKIVVVFLALFLFSNCCLSRLRFLPCSEGRR